MPNSSTIQIIYDGSQDITNNCIFTGAKFTLQAAAQIGTFELLVKDPDQTLSFVSGRELSLVLDGQPLWGGFVRVVGQKYATIVDTSIPADVKVRQWTLRGVDYNVLFDARYMHNDADELHLLPNFTKTRYDGDLIKNELCAKYLDIPAGFDTSSHVDDVLPPFDPLVEGGSGIGEWLQLGSSWRAQMEDFINVTGAIYYLSAGKFLEYHGLEATLAPFGFSDVPDGTNFIGPRGDAEIVEDGSVIVNDAMIWGGSQFAGSGQTVFAREQNGPSIAEHQRWQRAETNFGDKLYMLQEGVDARAKVIVDGQPGVVGGDDQRGLRFPQMSVKLSWFSYKVPGRNHLKPGQVTTFNFWVMSEDGGITPLTLVLPLRQLDMEFPNLDKGGDPYVIFTGYFGLQISDPRQLWTFIRHALIKVQKQPGTLATNDGSSVTSAYGTLFSGPFVEVPDGSRQQFSLPNGFGYIAGTTQVYLGGKLLIPGGVGYDELDPLGGLIEFTNAPLSGDQLWVRCYLT